MSDGDVIVTEMTMPDMVPAMKRASGIITDEGGMTSHAAIVSRELGVPAIVGTTNATTVLNDGEVVTLDGERGAVLEGAEVEPEEETEPVEEVRPQSPVKPMTATEVKVNVSIPEAAERAAATGADGVGLLRTEHMILSLNQTPEKFIEENGADAYTNELVQGIRSVADEFYPALFASARSTRRPTSSANSRAAPTSPPNTTRCSATGASGDRWIGPTSSPTNSRRSAGSTRWDTTTSRSCSRWSTTRRTSTAPNGR